ncbi:MAG: CRISPR system precrRNA processing endoribonuclease RAMP protein Cas6, partial [Chloroflexota bacterium]|nr:CRISPR system precrRNA processing endoribonuclease RAMP protein Cas6 [Chloroflexota bacterium]
EDAPTSADGQSLSLTFLTPTRLVLGGTALQRPEPRVLLQRIAERLDAVAAAVGADAPHLLDDPTFTAAIGQLEMRDDATQWIGDDARGGFVGSATLVGAPDDAARIATVLRWGAALGVGKGTLHGAGRFVVGPVPPTARIALAAEEPQQPVASPRSKPAPNTPRTRRSDTRPRRSKKR